MHVCFYMVVDWWGSYAGRAIELQRFAKRVVSLCASSSGCERNWSTFEFVSNYVFISASLITDLQQVVYSLYLLFVDPYKEKEPATTSYIE